MKNKQLWKSLSACALATALVAGCLTGCGKEPTNNEATSESKVTSEQSTETAQPTEEVKEIVELTYWCALDAATQASLTDFDDMEMLQNAQEKVGVIIDYSHPASGTETEQFNLKMTNLNLEDIIEYNWGSYPGGPSQAIADGIIIDLAPYIEAGLAPNLSKVIEENPHILQQITTDKGEIWAFPAISIDAAQVLSGYIVRYDMLEKVGLDVPTTIADWEEMLTAFKEKLGLEKPLTGQQGQYISTNAYLAGAWDTYPGYYLRNGKVTYGYMDDSFKDYLETIARWYKNGLLDADIFGNDTKTASSNILNDKSGAIYGYIGSTVGTLTTSAAETNPDLVLSGVPFPVLKEGDTASFMSRSWEVKADGQAAISTKCENIEAAIAYLDFWYSEEGQLMKNFGVEGKSYTMVNGEPIYTDEILKNPDGLSISHALGKYTRATQSSVGLIHAGYYEGYYELQAQKDTLKLWNDNLDINAVVAKKLPSISATSEDAEELASLENALKTYVQEECTKFIMGLRSLDEFDKFVDVMKNTYKVERVLEIYQKAYEAYMNK